MTGDTARTPASPKPPTPAAKKGRGGRQAVSGMMEALILIGIAVGGIAALAVWFGGFGDSGSSVWANTHCTLHVSVREGVGGGNDYIGITVRNTGGIDITGFEARVGDSVVFDHVGAILPGGTEEMSNVSSALAGGGDGTVFAEAVATYTDGSRTVCDRVTSMRAGG